MSVRWMLWSLASPSQLLLLALILGSLLLALGHNRFGKVITLTAAAGLFVFGLLPTSHYLAAALESRFPAAQLPPQVTGIVLLAGAERPAASEAHGQPQLGPSGGRHSTAQRLARQFPDARIVFSGGPMQEPGRGPLETQPAVARALFKESGFEMDRLVFDEKSGDTCATPTNVRRLVQPKAGETWIVVTSAIHMPRTMACFGAAGWSDVIPQPADYRVALGSWDLHSFRIADNLKLLDEAMHEWLGLVYYRVSGRTRELFPS